MAPARDDSIHPDEAELEGSGEEPQLGEHEPPPLFRNEGGAEAARDAQREMEGIMSDYLSIRSVVGA